MFDRIIPARDPKQCGGVGGQWTIMMMMFRRDRDPHFVRACGVEMHLDIAQEPFCAEIYR